MISKRTAAVLLTLAVIPAIDTLLPYNARISPQMPSVLIYALVASGLNIVTGFTGLLHLGIAAFMAIGAFSFSILSTSIYPFQLGFCGAAFLAAIFSGFCGLLLAIPTVRLRGDYLAIVTLGFGEIIQDVIRNLDVITKGTQGINPVAAPVVLGYAFTGASVTAWYYLILAILALVAFGIERLQDSHIGRSWMAVRDDELAASCMAVQPVKTKLGSFAIGAMIAGLGGALMASLLGSSGEPSNYDFQISIMTLSTVIIGGMASIPGAIVGAVVMMGINVIALPKLASLATSLGIADSSGVFVSPGNWKYLIFGLALIIMMRFRSEGILPAKINQRQVL